MGLVQLKGTAHVRTEMKDFTTKELLIMLCNEIKQKINNKIGKIMMR